MTIHTTAGLHTVAGRTAESLGNSANWSSECLAEAGGYGVVVQLVALTVAAEGTDGRTHQAERTPVHQQGGCLIRNHRRGGLRETSAMRPATAFRAAAWW